MNESLEDSSLPNKGEYPRQQAACSSFLLAFIVTSLNGHFLQITLQDQSWHNDNGEEI